ncbi:MAG: SDR family oxidoreductase, partial [Cytophagaceae bacterium]
MILITGATGQLGRAILHTLVQKTAPSHLAALVREAGKAADLQAQGIDIRVGDYSDPASLDRAMQGVTKVLLISGGGSPDALQQHYNVVDAAQKAGVQCLAYTSRALKDPAALANTLMVRHFQTEDYIKASGLPYLLFRNILYMDVLPYYVGKDVRTTGLNLPGGQGRVPYALRSDLGEAIANALLTSPCANTTFVLTGREAYSFDDVAAGLTTVYGQPVPYTAVEPAALAAQMQAQGYPPFMFQHLLGFLTDIKNGQEADATSDLERLLGRPPITLQEGLFNLFSC